MATDLAPTSRSSRDAGRMTSGRAPTDARSVPDRPAFVGYARRAYRALAWLFVACVMVQVFLVGLEIFKVIGDDAGLHRNFAYLYGWLLPLMLVVGRFARLSVRMLALVVLLLVMFAVQTVLPELAKQVPLLGPLHAVNALAILLLAIWLAQHAARVEGEATVRAG
jgi:hypothetical protein